MALNRQLTPGRQYTYQPYQMRHVASFRKLETKTTGAGVNISVPVEVFKLHYADVRQTMDQRYLTAGRTVTFTRTIAVRHDRRLDSSLHVFLDKQEYGIAEISPNDENYNSYDLLMLSAVKKGGGSDNG